MNEQEQEMGSITVPEVAKIDRYINMVVSLRSRMGRKHLSEPEVKICDFSLYLGNYGTILTYFNPNPSRRSAAIHTQSDF